VEWRRVWWVLLPKTRPKLGANTESNSELFRINGAKAVWKRVKRRVSVEGALVFDYEVSPHRAFLVKMAAQNEKRYFRDAASERSAINSACVRATGSAGLVSQADGTSGIGAYVPFKQSRLKG